MLFEIPTVAIRYLYFFLKLLFFVKPNRSFLYSQWLKVNDIQLYVLNNKKKKQLSSSLFKYGFLKHLRQITKSKTFVVGLPAIVCNTFPNVVLPVSPPAKSGSRPQIQCRRPLFTITSAWTGGKIVEVLWRLTK